jgi:hypothetical protein
MIFMARRTFPRPTLLLPSARLQSLHSVWIRPPVLRSLAARESLSIADFEFLVFFRSFSRDPSSGLAGLVFSGCFPDDPCGSLAGIFFVCS